MCCVTVLKMVFIFCSKAWFVCCIRCNIHKEESERVLLFFRCLAQGETIPVPDLVHVRTHEM